MILRVSRKGIETRSVLLPPAPKHWLTPSLWQRPPLCTARYTYRHRHRLSYTTSFWQLHTQMCLEDMKGPHPKAAQPSCSLSLSFPSVCSLSSSYLFGTTVSFPPSKSSLSSPSRQNLSIPPSCHASVLSVSLLQLSCLLSQSSQEIFVIIVYTELLGLMPSHRQCALLQEPILRESLPSKLPSP